MLTIDDRGYAEMVSISPKITAILSHITSHQSIKKQWIELGFASIVIISEFRVFILIFVLP